MPQRSRPHGFRTEHRDGPMPTGTDRTACDANTIDTDHIMTDGNPARWEPEPPRSRRVRRQVGFSLKLLTPAGLRSIRRGLHRPDWRARRACPTVCERNRRCVRPRRSAHPGRPDPGMHDLAGRGVLQADQLQRRTGSFADSKVASLPPGTIILKVENGAPIKVGRGHIEPVDLADIGKRAPAFQTDLHQLTGQAAGDVIADKALDDRIALDRGRSPPLEAAASRASASAGATLSLIHI